MNIKTITAFAATTAAVVLAFTSFVPLANAQALPPMLGPAMRIIQGLEQQVKELSSTVAGFAESFTTKELTFTHGQGSEIDVQTLCVGNTCIDEAQLQALLAAQNTPAVQSNSVSNTDTTATTTILISPIIEINGNNPAIVQTGTIYNDLGATITGPEADLDLGIQTFVNGAPMSLVQIDTSEPATDTIDYVVTDQNGLTSTSSRNIIVEAAASGATTTQSQ